MKPKDIILFSVVTLSSVVGIFFPSLGTPLEPFLVHFMIVFVFLNFLGIELTKIIRTLMDVRLMTMLLLVKLLAIPLFLYLLAKSIYPSYALPVLLLSGISTGVVAPFISNMLSGNTEIVISMLVLSSALIPFTLPILVKLVIGQTIDVSLFAMVQLLAMIIFIPITAREILKRYIPWVIEWGQKVRYPYSVIYLGCTCMAMFGKYSGFFLSEPKEILIATVVAFFLSAFYLTIGAILLHGRSKPDQLAGSVSMAFINNLLALIFSLQFFGPMAATLAAMYNFPYFAMIFPIRYLFKVSNTAQGRA
jgi:BASS family bile acid:Na+ symporter